MSVRLNVPEQNRHGERPLVQIINPDTRLSDEAQVIPGPGCILKAKQVAEWLDCHVSTVYDLLEQDRLRGFSLTGRTEKGTRGRKGIRILASSVRAFIASGIEEFGKGDQAGQSSPARVEQGTTIHPPVSNDVTKPAQSTPNRPRQPEQGRPKSRVVLPYPGQTRRETP